MANRDLYYDWLIDFIKWDPDYNPDDYSCVLHRLYSQEFTYTVVMDENRYADGMNLKDRYVRTEIPFDCVRNSSEGDYCSILEMMIALAIRIEDDIKYDPDYGDRTSLWFWFMMENLGLDQYWDAMYDDFEVDDIIRRLIDRKYDKNGENGALFHVKRRDIDMANVEIWYQMNYYFAENIDENWLD